MTETYDEDRTTGTATLTELVQFLRDGAPVQYPDELTDTVHVIVAGSNVGNYHPVATEWNADFDLAVDRTWTATREAGDITIHGSGNLGGSTTFHVGTSDYARTTSVEWTTNLAYDAGNPCVHGTVVGGNARTSFTGAFDGQGTASWEIVRGGTVVRSGSLTYTCAGPG